MSCVTRVMNQILVKLTNLKTFAKKLLPVRPKIALCVRKRKKKNGDCKEFIVTHTKGNKAHGHVMFNIIMLKLSGISI